MCGSWECKQSQMIDKGNVIQNEIVSVHKETRNPDICKTVSTIGHQYVRQNQPDSQILHVIFQMQNLDCMYLCLHVYL